MRIVESTDVKAIEALVRRSRQSDGRVERRVRRIVQEVRRRGDDAVMAYARRLDRLQGPLEITRSEIESAARQVPAPTRDAIRLAVRNIRRVARRQVPKGWRLESVPGVAIEQRVTPLERVGCYVPGGRYPLPSSLLMTAVPARTAGVREVIAVCPSPNPTILFAALEANVDRLFRVGGAHAIAALAYGTTSIPRVDKIVGPGSMYVAAAKGLVSHDCAIDFFAGPSEIVVVSSGGNPRWIAADLIAQAEHDPEARAVLLTPSRHLAEQVSCACNGHFSQNRPAREALTRNGAIVVTGDLSEAIALSQRMAPEHVVCDDERAARRLTIAGTVFVGRWSAQALGDYVTGSNHVLPTNGMVRARGGLTAADFVRITTVQRVTKRGLERLGPAAAVLAEAEGLSGHAASIATRLGTRG